VKERLLLDHRYALGDTVLMTALVRDIHRAYPGRFEIGLNTHWTPVWANNPHVTQFADGSKPPPRRVEIHYGAGIVEAGRGRKTHMLAWYHEDFRRRTGLAVPVTFPGGDLHLTDAERRPFISGRYWVILSGGKLDLTAKWWPAENAQKLVDTLGAYGIRFVQVGAAHSAHIHPPLSGVLNLVGKTENARDLFNIILHADGVVCGVTGAMHIAAALERPCVVLAGGREEPWWEGYSGAYKAFGPNCPDPKVPHRFLHTVGTLHCCSSKGCWKNRTVALEAKDRSSEGQRRLCVEVVRRPDSPARPLCLDRVTVDHAAEAVLSYYADGTLPALR
jgi:hypothetical protein